MLLSSQKRFGLLVQYQTLTEVWCQSANITF